MKNKIEACVHPEVSKELEEDRRIWRRFLRMVCGRSLSKYKSKDGIGGRMIFKKKKKIPMELGLMLGMKVCVAKFNVKYNRDEAKVGYIIARRSYFALENGRHWKYLVKFSDGTTEEYKEEDIYLDYDRRLEDEKQ